MNKNNKNNKNNIKYAFIEFGTKSCKIGRVEMELYSDIVPKTVNNFMTLITGRKGYGYGYGYDYGYKGCIVHRIIPNFCIQTGDFTKGDGSGGNSIYGNTFEDENFELQHDEAGLLSMANCGPDTNGSQFFITLDILPHLDNKHVVFGKVINGMDVVRRVEKYGSSEGTTKDIIRIVNCGEI